MHPEDLLTAIQEFYMCHSYHKNMDESAKEENSQETIDIPQDIPENSDVDLSSLVVEAQDDIMPQIQSSKETESCCTFAQRNTRPFSPLKKEGIDHIINGQPTSEIFCTTDILAHSSDELCCTELESSHVNQNEEILAENTMCLTGSII